MLLVVPSRPAARTAIGKHDMNAIKKNLKRTLGLLALSTLLLGSTDVQARGGCQDFLSQIELSDDQQKAIDTARGESREARRDIFSNDELSREEKIDALRSLMDETEKSINDVLTPEQRAEIERLKAERVEARLDRRMKKLTERLSLSADQATEIRQIYVTARGDIETLKDSDLPREEKREEFQAIKDKIKTDIAVLLDDGQTEIFNNMNARRSNRGRRNRRG